MNKQTIIGNFENIDFPEYGMDGVVAKIDTGAFSGALHCTKIEKVGDELKFSPFDHPEISINTSKFNTRRVKSSNGKSEKRYFVKTIVTIQGKNYELELSLADRSEMKVPVLVGRRFLSHNHFLVDVNRTDGIVT